MLTNPNLSDTACLCQSVILSRAGEQIFTTFFLFHEYFLLCAWIVQNDSVGVSAYTIEVNGDCGFSKYLLLCYVEERKS